jgi:hypothetical protein
MGDPQALTTQGQDHTLFEPGIAGVARRAELLGEDEHADEPNLPATLRKRALRIGFFKVEKGGFLGIGEQERYVRADMIDSVEGDHVTLKVTAERLPGEWEENREPLDTD